MSKAIRWVSTAIFTILILPVLVANIQKLLAVKHWDEFLVNWWPAMSNLGSLINSSYFWYCLVFSGGVAVAMWVIRLWPEKSKVTKQQSNQQLEIKDIDLMPFKTVFSKFKEEIKRESPEDYHSMGSMIERQNQDQENIFVMRFGQIIDVDIYGKIPSPSFQDWVKIDEDLFFNCKIKNGLELYRNNVLEYTDLAIKKSDLGKAMKESKLSLTDEFISRLYKEVN